MCMPPNWLVWFLQSAVCVISGGLGWHGFWISKFGARMCLCHFPFVKTIQIVIWMWQPFQTIPKLWKFTWQLTGSNEERVEFSCDLSDELCLPHCWVVWISREQYGNCLVAQKLGSPGSVHCGMSWVLDEAQSRPPQWGKSAHPSLQAILNWILYRIFILMPAHLNVTEHLAAVLTAFTTFKGVNHIW